MRLPMNRQSPPVIVEYDVQGGKRIEKEFSDPYEARRFYSSKLKNGKNPIVKKVQNTTGESND